VGGNSLVTAVTEFSDPTGGDITHSAGFAPLVWRMCWSRALHTALPYRSAYPGLEHVAIIAMTPDRLVLAQAPGQGHARSVEEVGPSIFQGGPPRLCTSSFCNKWYISRASCSGTTALLTS